MSSHVVTYVSGLYMGKGLGERVEKNRAATKPISRPRIYPAWRSQHSHRLAGPAFSPLGGASILTAWRGQHLHRLTGAAFTPLGEASILTV